ncbi:PREDICTED: histone-lysine N-methyltransferase SETMAR-like [Dinoponera quadriceps]|uniref:Histone-lysine N-methyltransferase SETMAR-like n=1 Tax=Dinoponera quadriceps TaxID=609295 RepID=A0A6P3YHC5_DINQU|nr:PREDICTED: histone-lysine N-methyltransferase SETMAR-like [Dinoponera quadriceps]
MVNKLNVWMPHELNKNNVMGRILATNSLLKRHQNEPFLKQIISGDLKWIVYNNKSIVYYELLPPNKPIDSNKHGSQLVKSMPAIDQKLLQLANRKGVTFHQNNVKQQVSLMTRQKLLQLGWDVLLRPKYNSDLAPSDYHLFRALQNNLNNKTFSSLDALKNHLDDFFAQKSQDFYERRT